MCYNNAPSHLYGIAVNHHKYDAAGVSCTPNTEVQEVVPQTGRQDQWLLTPGDKQQAPRYKQAKTLQLQTWHIYMHIYTDLLNL